jgi:hypothetical protein
MFVQPYFKADIESYSCAMPNVKKLGDRQNAIC